MAKSSSNPVGAFIGGLIGVGVFLHLLHEATDGYTWAAGVASACPWCRFRGN